MPRKVIITCALTGGQMLTDQPKHRFVPVTPEEIANEALVAAEAGAAVVHVHVRDPETRQQSSDVALYREVHDRIRAKNKELIINFTAGVGGRIVLNNDDVPGFAETTNLMSPKARTAHITEIRPDMCTIDVATMSFGENTLVNQPSHLREMAAEMLAAGAKPEIETFDTGHVRLAAHLVAEGALPKNPLFQFCLGIPWGAPANADAIQLMKSLLPPNATWAAFGISRHQMPMVAQAALLGGHVRVGLEDNLHLAEGVLAESNSQLVAQAVGILEGLNMQPATPVEAREILEIA